MQHDTKENPLRRLTDSLNPGETLLITSTLSPAVGRLTRHASSFDVTIQADGLEDAEVLDSGHFLTLQSALDFLDDAFDTKAGESLSGRPDTGKQAGHPGAGKQTDKPDASKNADTKTQDA